MTTNQTIALTTPAQINMWVLLSRRSQLKMQMGMRPDGTPSNVKMPTPGLLKWCKANVGPQCTTAKRALHALNELIEANGGPEDPAQNYIVAMSVRQGGTLFADQGIVKGMSAVSANEEWVNAYKVGRLHIVMTPEDVRPHNGNVYKFED